VAADERLILWLTLRQCACISAITRAGVTPPRRRTIQRIFCWYCSLPI
jgi:hypothetical protein